MPSANSPNAPLFVLEALNGRTYHGPTLEDALQDMRASAWACTERTLSGYMKFLQTL